MDLRQRQPKESAAGVCAPTMPDLFAAVADRAVRRAALWLIFWGLLSLAVASVWLPESSVNGLVLVIGAAMTAIGIFFFCRPALNVYVGLGVALAFAGAWYLGAAFIEWTLGVPCTAMRWVWGSMGLVQLLWAYAALRYGSHWHSVLRRNLPDPPGTARRYLSRLVHASPNSPDVVALAHGPLRRLPAFGRGRAYVGLRDVLVVNAWGANCFALSFDEAERALNGELVWDSNGIERRLFVRPVQAEKLRQMMAAAKPIATGRPADSG